MNSQLVSFELKEKYLLVIGHGQRNNLASMNEAAAQIYAKMQEVKSTRLLVDYRQLEINVHFNEAFNIVKRYEVAQPELRNVKIAALFDEAGREFGRYWKEIASQRGFHIELFDRLDEAERWLITSKQS